MIPPLVHTSHSQQRPRLGTFKGTLPVKNSGGNNDAQAQRKELSFDSDRIQGMDATSDRSLLVNMNYMQ